MQLTVEVPFALSPNAFQTDSGAYRADLRRGRRRLSLAHAVTTHRWGVGGIRRPDPAVGTAEARLAPAGAPSGAGAEKGAIVCAKKPEDPGTSLFLEKELQVPAVIGDN